MKKRILAIALVFICSISLFGCGCKHEWKEATCTEPKTCSKCGETEGEALGHSWEEATCEKPKTCSRCNATEGEALGHSVTDWNIDKEATCAEEGSKSGQCTVCKKTITMPIEKTEHTPGDWEITQVATPTTQGERAIKCTVCGQVIQTEAYSLSPEEKIAIYKQNCTNYSYDEIARNPDTYKGKYAKLTGQVIQVMEDGDSYTLRVDITKKGSYWTDTILVSYTKQDANESRILEDDVITMYGMLAGTYTYKTVMGSSLTVPLLYAEYIE